MINVRPSYKPILISTPLPRAYEKNQTETDTRLNFEIGSTSQDGQMLLELFSLKSGSGVNALKCIYSG